jgi:hypothetical protein
LLLCKLALPGLPLAFLAAGRLGMQDISLLTCLIAAVIVGSRN